MARGKVDKTVGRRRQPARTDEGRPHFWVRRRRRSWVERHQFGLYALAALVGLLGAGLWLKRDSLPEAPQQIYFAVIGAPFQTAETQTPSER